MTCQNIEYLRSNDIEKSYKFQILYYEYNIFPLKLFNGYVIAPNGKAFIKNGKYHKLDGPAKIFDLVNPKKYEWYYNGQFINCNSQNEFEKIIKLLVFK